MPEIRHILTGFHFSTDQGWLGVSTTTLIRGVNNIIVDPGPKGRSDLLRETLAKMQVMEEDINMIILTHAHWDHCQNIDMFPNAKILMHPRELEYAASPRKGDLSTARYFLAMLEDRDVEEIVEGDELESGIRILDTPGHTRGHISALVDAPEGLTAIAGDALPWAKSVITGLPTTIFWDETEGADSVKKLLDASSIFYPGHDRPFNVGPRNAVQYIGGADSIRLRLGHDGVGDLTIRVAPDPPHIPRIIE